MRSGSSRKLRSILVVLLSVVALLVLEGFAGAAGPPTSTTTTTTAPSAGGAFIGFGSSGGFSFGVGSGPSVSVGSTGPFGSRVSLRRVSRRGAAGGVQLRIYEGDLTSGGAPVPPVFPSPSCLPDREVLVDVSTDAVAGAVTFYGRSTQSVGPQGSYVGQAEGTPVAVVAAQVAAGTQAAVMHFAGGPTDRAAPLPGGWVILAAPVKAPPVVRRPVPLLTDTTPSLGTLSTIDKRGHEHPVGSVRAAIGYTVPTSCLPHPPSGGVGGSSSQGLTPATTTPTTLPPPTGPPPTDPTQARQAIETAYRKIFESKANRNNNRYLQGAPVLTPSELAQLQAGYGDILGKLRVRINDFRFLSTTTAALSFDLLLNGQPISPTTIGQAVLVKGQWQVARATFCAVIGRANIPCG
jgi:hypothetical protein